MNKKRRVYPNISGVFFSFTFPRVKWITLFWIKTSFISKFTFFHFCFRCFSNNLYFTFNFIQLRILGYVSCLPNIRESVTGNELTLIHRTTCASGIYRRNFIAVIASVRYANAFYRLDALSHSWMNCKIASNLSIERWKNCMHICFEHWFIADIWHGLFKGSRMIVEWSMTKWRWRRVKIEMLRFRKRISILSFNCVGMSCNVMIVMIYGKSLDI